ncbi:MAG: phosphonate ABC transporter ATP-binding protein [Pseudonocardia sp.]
MSVHVRGLRVAFPGHAPVLDGLDLTVGRGEIVALVGANGAGKTTLLRSLVRLVEPEAGTVLVNGSRVTGARGRELRRIRAGVGYVFQRLHLVGRLPAFHNVLHGTLGRDGTLAAVPALAGAGRRAAAMDALDRVGLAELAARRVDRLSGGQQQRVAVARVLAQRPALVLADEPAASLDPATSVAVLSLLRVLAVEGLTVVVALHHLDHARRYADRIVGLHHGRIVLDQPAATCPGTDLDELYAPAGVIA